MEMMENREELIDVTVLGAGLTGLTTAYLLAKQGKRVVVLEKESRVGGQICTHHERGYTFEAGPNTGVLSNQEVIRLLEELEADCAVEIANPHAKRRLIWKRGRFQALPHSLLTAVKTPLFRWRDKFRILVEPFREKGNDPNESVASLVRRRLGKSFLDYAVDPFISGVYAGDPQQLVTRFALPKLYSLEQQYGSFIKGAIAKKRTQTEADKQVTKEVFSTFGGLETLVRSLASRLPSSSIRLACEKVEVTPCDEGWKLSFQQNGELRVLKSSRVVSTLPAYELEQTLPFVDLQWLEPLTQLVYAPVVQVSVGVKEVAQSRFNAFGGLVPSVEGRNVLGILFPSACFANRAPKHAALFSFFLGGVRHPELVHLSTEELYALVYREFEQMLDLSVEDIELLQLFKYEKAIPQYRADSELRYQRIRQLEEHYPGLVLAGNMRDGIGMSDRIRQAYMIAEELK